MLRLSRYALVGAVQVTLLTTPQARAQEDDHGHDHDESVGAVPEAERDHPPDPEDRHVDLDAATQEEFGIVVGTAGPMTLETTLELPGEVRPNADRLAHIVPRYSGIVTEVRAHIGDRVSTGDVLAVVESDESLVPFEVTTLISGTVIEKHVALGEAADRDRVEFVIADLSTVWIELTVYQRDLRLVRAGQPVRLFVGHDLVFSDVVIDYVSPVLDPHTRTATARVVTPNPDLVWRPGMFVSAAVVVERETVPVAVPATALFTLDDDRVVFVATDHGFVPRAVTVGRESTTVVEILHGIEPGESVVTEGGFTLKAELAKGSFGHGHAH
jgi:cobalt-zinc-cadmium efflux system membrane fusion protein